MSGKSFFNPGCFGIYIVVKKKKLLSAVELKGSNVGQKFFNPESFGIYVMIKKDAGVTLSAEYQE